MGLWPDPAGVRGLTWTAASQHAGRSWGRRKALSEAGPKGAASGEGAVWRERGAAGRIGRCHFAGEVGGQRWSWTLPRAARRSTLPPGVVSHAVTCPSPPVTTKDYQDVGYLSAFRNGVGRQRACGGGRPVLHQGLLGKRRESNTCWGGHANSRRPASPRAAPPQKVSRPAAAPKINWGKPSVSFISASSVHARRPGSSPAASPARKGSRKGAQSKELPLSCPTWFVSPSRGEGAGRRPPRSTAQPPRPRSLPCPPQARCRYLLTLGGRVRRKRLGRWIGPRGLQCAGKEGREGRKRKTDRRGYCSGEWHAG